MRSAPLPFLAIWSPPPHIALAVYIETVRNREHVRAIAF
jgi:hypothetical protein